ncbi:MAG TPA: hypothetical protein VGF32_20355 [Streptosporangiaceae bacterium]
MSEAVRVGVRLAAATAGGQGRSRQWWQVVCDNVVIHRSKIVRRWLQAHSRQRVLHGRATARTTTRSSGSGVGSRRD